MNRNLINYIISALLILSLGLTSGFIIGRSVTARKYFPEIKLVDEINEKISTVKLLEIRNGNLIGEIAGREVRIAYSANSISDFSVGQTFSIPLTKINLADYYKERSIPKDAQFVASKNGKYYYSVLDKQALNLSEANRIYFPDEETAKKAGYIKR